MGIIGSALATLISYSVATFTIGLTKKTFHQSVMMVKSILFLNLFKLILNAWQSNSKKK